MKIYANRLSVDTKVYTIVEGNMMFTVNYISRRGYSNFKYQGRVSSLYAPNAPIVTNPSKSLVIPIVKMVSEYKDKMKIKSSAGVQTIINF